MCWNLPSFEGKGEEMGSCCYLGSLEHSHLGVCTKESNERRENCQGRHPETSVYLVKTYCATVGGTEVSKRRSSALMQLSGKGIPIGGFG